LIHLLEEFPMLLKYFYDAELAQASYMVGCEATGEALVVDPARDIAPYLQTAAQEGLRITQVTETHIHADFVSGSREIAARTGATIYLSDMGDTDWKYAFAADPNVILVRDGDSWMVGNVKVDGQPLQATARLSANLARSRRRQRVRQGAGRAALHHSGL
jgi:hydroxyacylglutathione hydrolase